MGEKITSGSIYRDILPDHVTVLLTWRRKKRMKSSRNILKANSLSAEDLPQIRVKIDPNSVIWILKIVKRDFYYF